MGKKIVVCIDGTNSKPTSGRTNVSRFARIVAKIPGQIVYYQPGVGTLDPDNPGIRIIARCRRLWDLAVARLISRHVQSAYRYLMDVYDDGDEIFLIGFSRGAFTCRVLGGMLTKVGLLHRGQQEMIPYAWKIYVPPRNFEEAARFRKYYARQTKVAFLGIWDTVRTVGSPWRPMYFPNSQNNRGVAIVRHALALDERRALYPTNLWRLDGTKRRSQDVLQVWFPGAHSDVGGGYTGDNNPGLAAISLAWMIREAESANLTMDNFERERLLKRKGAARSGNLTVETVANEFIADEMHDEIEDHWYWRLFEWIPIPRWSSKGNGEWERRWYANNSQPRFAPPGTYFHKSITMRKKKDPGYHPANLPENLPDDAFVW